MEKYSDLLNRIKFLSTEHSKLNSDLSDEKDAEQIELEVEQLITSYCEEKSYLVKGFPTEKRKLTEDKLEEDYFCRERYQLYLDTLATQQNDVAELMWCYVSSFWADQYESKEEYIQNLKDNLDSGVFYDVTI
jgi:hypothetical protein